MLIYFHTTLSINTKLLKLTFLVILKLFSTLCFFESLHLQVVIANWYSTCCMTTLLFLFFYPLCLSDWIVSKLKLIRSFQYFAYPLCTGHNNSIKNSSTAILWCFPGYTCPTEYVNSILNLRQYPPLTKLYFCIHRWRLWPTRGPTGGCGWDPSFSLRPFTPQARPQSSPPPPQCFNPRAPPMSSSPSWTSTPTT